MIIDIPDTTASKVARKLVKVREEGGQVALSRVLNLVILAQPHEIESSIEAANAASSEHPCRVIVVTDTGDSTSRELNAQIRVGGDAGASEVIVLTAATDLVKHTDTLVMPLLLPDAPIVAWWPSIVPEIPSREPIGTMAQTRLTDSVNSTDPEHNIRVLRDNHKPGDVDLAWTRATLWRGLIATALDQPPFDPVTAVDIEGDEHHPSLDLIGAWLANALNVPVTIKGIDGAQGLTRVALHRNSGLIEFSRPDGKRATLKQPNMPDQHLNLPIRSLEDCLAEEMRRLHPDVYYTEVLEHGLPLVKVTS
ncbi:glucose-6-phosphate dehydrogenase assembly protein OpcA [Timonella sp. A28]|uniref:glucose-6-phosphate dehydrogenase assembly protein OpcA n=1 Tax=Timonella sp. A28 TaxID=3442640 RepID=UPI003EBFF137